MYLTIKLFIVFNPLLFKLIDSPPPLPQEWLKKHCKYLLGGDTLLIGQF